tara:strand:+ start:152 stop:334 length:183 start_codon:yes stop_codon:yes gene_type:complete
MEYNTNIYRKTMQVKVKLHINGHIFTESVATDDVFVAEDIALARNPGAEIISSNLSNGWW